VRFRWAHPVGPVEATFVMLPDDDRLFVEVVVRARKPIKRWAVSLCCWPAGRFRARTAAGMSPDLTYGKVHRFPDEAPTVLLTDPAADRKGRRAEGTCALTYFPSECASATAKRTLPLYVTLNMRPPRPGTPASAHVVLWELLHRRGDDAWRYLARREAETLARFDALPGIQAPRFAERRRQGLLAVRKQLDALDGRKGLISPWHPKPTLRKGYWSVPGPGLAFRWVQFYRGEAQYQLQSEDWRAASRAIEQAGRHLDGVLK